jgi:transcriptional regulator with XRE-family HTH domain
VASAVSSPERRRRDARGQLTEIGSTIRGLTRDQGRSLRDLGRAAGFSIIFLSLVERGRSSLPLTSLHAIAVALGVEMSPLFPQSHPEPVSPAQINRRCQDARLSIRVLWVLTPSPC